jgi:hypothetical protein
VSTYSTPKGPNLFENTFRESFAASGLSTVSLCSFCQILREIIAGTFRKRFGSFVHRISGDGRHEDEDKGEGKGNMKEMKKQPEVQLGQ